MPGDLIWLPPVPDFCMRLTTGATFIESGRYKKVVVVGADKMSAIVDYSDRNTCVIIWRWCRCCFA